MIESVSQVLNQHIETSYNEFHKKAVNIGTKQGKRERGKEVPADYDTVKPY
jgi:hypothetical protein